MQPQARLSVGIISAGRVGVALARVFQDAGHEVYGVVAHSDAALQRAEALIPDIPVRRFEEVAQAALVLICVPDRVLPQVVRDVAQVVQSGQIVAHTSGAFGCDILQPVTDEGALPLALHPAMTFTGSAEDAHRLVGCAWGVTSDSEAGAAVAELLINSIDGVPVAIPEEQRALYHAAMAQASNHVVTVIADALAMLRGALGDVAERSALAEVSVGSYGAELLSRLTHAAVDNALQQGISGLTGPIARGDLAMVERHMRALGAVGDGALVEAYRALALRTAALADRPEIEQRLIEYPW